MYRLLADLTVVVHLAFLAFVVCGGILGRRWRWMVPLHLAAVGWGILAELDSQIICPLTTLQKWFAHQAGLAGYSDGFVAHYFAPILQHAGLPLTWKYALILGVLAFNVFVYLPLLWGHSKHAGSNPRSVKMQHRPGH